MTAYGMAATVDFGLDAKQGLLDLRSENARLRLVDAAVPRRDEAPGLHRERAGAGALEREGPLRMSGSAPSASSAANASTTRASNCVPAPRRSSASARPRATPRA